MDGSSTRKTAADMIDFQLPFPCCRVCPRMVLEVQDVKMWADDEIAEREIILKCTNAGACMFAVNHKEQ